MGGNDEGDGDGVMVMLFNSFIFVNTRFGNVSSSHSSVSTLGRWWMVGGHVCFFVVVGIELR